MSQLNKTQFEATYEDSVTGTFLTNTTQAIGSDDLRQFAEDIRESVPFTLSDQFTWAKGLNSGISNTSAGAIAAVKAITSVGVSVGVFLMQRITDSANQVRIYELIASTDADNGILTIRPTDYAASTNEKVWKKCDAAAENVPALPEVLNAGNSADGLKITDLDTPTDSADAATKGYVDLAVSAGDTLVADVAVSSADILSIGSSRKTIIAAPGSGNIIMPLFPIFIEIIPSGAAYATETDLIFETAAAAAGRVSETLTGFLALASDTFRQVGERTGNVTVSGGISFLDNQPLTLTTPTGTNPTAGGGTVRVIVTYKIIAL